MSRFQPLLPLFVGVAACTASPTQDATGPVVSGSLGTSAGAATSAPQASQSAAPSLSLDASTNMGPTATSASPHGVAPTATPTPPVAAPSESQTAEPPSSESSSGDGSAGGTLPGGTDGAGGDSPVHDGGVNGPHDDDATTLNGDASTTEGSDLCAAGVDTGAPPRILELAGDTFAHDPTVIAANGVFFRFWTGDYIPMASSTDLLTWRNGPSVYPNRYPDWVSEWQDAHPNNTFNFPWAPDVSYFGGQYHLYSAFSAVFGDNVSCISHLTTSDPASGEWTDHGPVICTEGNESYNAIDADVGLTTAGTPWLSFGSFWDGIEAFELDSEGERVGGSLTRLAYAKEIEAPVLFRRCGYYYLFVTWGLCCPGENRTVSDLTYRVAVGRAQEITGPYLDRDGVPMLEGGGTLLVQGDGVNFAAAGHSDVLVSGNTIYHVYHAYRQSNGSATLRIVELPFDADGWPVPGGP